MEATHRVLQYFLIRGVILLGLILIAAVSLPHSVYAQDAGQLGLEQVTQSDIGLGGGNLTLMIARIIRAFFGVLGIIAVGLIVWAGAEWMTAGGSEEKVLNAKKRMINAAIGLAVILLSFAIAHFVIKSLVGATTGIDGEGGSGIAAGIPPGFQGGGELGHTIEYVLPTPGSVDVPRDTSIAVQFKKFIVPDTLLKNIKDQNAAILEGELNTSNVKVYVKSLGLNSALTSADVTATVQYTTDNTSDTPLKKSLLVISPVNLLGSPNENSAYTVQLGNGIQQDDPATGKSSLFKDKNGYSWTFTVGTKVDLEPPKIISVYPSPDTKNNYTNSIITVNFNKPMLPSSILDTTTSGLMVRTKNGEKIAGSWDIVNLASSAQFTPDKPCGKSACGDPFFCLPSNMTVQMDAKAAVIDSKKGAPKGVLGTGLLSLTFNSLDGNNDGKAEGGEKDAASWSFEVGNTLDTQGPVITDHTPGIAQSFVVPESSLSFVFNEPLLMSSIGAIALDQPTNLSQWYYPKAEDVDGNGAKVEGAEKVSATKVYLYHAPFLASNATTVYQYKPLADERVRDRQNNCFVPGKSVSCNATKESPYCCDGKITNNQDACAAKFTNAP